MECLELGGEPPVGLALVTIGSTTTIIAPKKLFRKHALGVLDLLIKTVGLV